MRKLVQLGSVALVVALTLTSSMAVERTGKPLKWGSGGTSGNYYSMSTEIIEVCGGETKKPHFHEKGYGSVRNIDGATKNKYHLFWTQYDVLKLFNATNSKKYNDKRFKVISRMHEEPIHVLMPKNWSPETSGWSKLKSFVGLDGDKPMDIRLLKNQIIGSWGGSVKSVEALSSFMGLNLRVQELNEAQKKDPGMPTLLVGGAPYKPVEDILKTGKYKLVSIDWNMIKENASAADAYSQNSVTYTINGKLTPIKTISTSAMLMGKYSRIKSKNKDMRTLATCLEAHKLILAEESENSNWNAVYENKEDQINWDYFDLDEKKLDEYMKMYNE